VQAVRNDIHLVKPSLQLVADAVDPSVLHVQFCVDAATPVAVMVFYHVALVKEGELLTRVTSPVVYEVTRVVLPAGSHQLFSTADVGGGLDLRLFPGAALYADHSLPFASRTSFPVLVILEGAGMVGGGGSLDWRHGQGVPR
jgi:hypothetical protein